LDVSLFGTGAMATLVGGMLARAGHAVTLVGTWPAGLDALGRDGIEVTLDDGAFVVSVRARSLSDPAGVSDVAIVLVKAYATARVADAAVAATREGTLVTLQNGLGSREALQAAGAARLVVGTTGVGARLDAPGRVRGFLAETQVGGANPTHARGIATFLDAAGLPCRAVADIDRVLWTKLAVNCAVNPLTALHGVPNGALLDRPEWRDTLHAAAREAAAVAAALSLPLEVDVDAHVEAAVRATAGNRSSMLQDLSRGARTEIDAICGAVVTEGRKAGVPTPVNESLWAAVRAREGRPGQAA
jgi:2-dehydropantoate 2-reductase